MANNFNYRLNCLKKYGKNSLSYLSLSESLSHFCGKWEGYIPYKELFKVAVILGDPVVTNESICEAVNDFKEKCSCENLHICLFLCTNKVLEQLKKIDFKVFYFGKEAIVDLDKFYLDGKKHASIRSSVNYAERHKMSVEEYDYKLTPSKSTEERLKKISKEWNRFKKIPELSFAFGRLDFDKRKDIRYFICKHKEKIVGFISYYPILGSNRYYLDFMRRGLNSPRGVIDYLIVKSFEILKKEKVKKVHIGFAPLSFLRYDVYNHNIVNKLLIMFKPFLEYFYPIQSEFFHKKKFATEWESNFICYYPRLSIRMILSVMHALYEGGFAAMNIYKLNYFMKRNG